MRNPTFNRWQSIKVLLTIAFTKSLAHAAPGTPPAPPQPMLGLGTTAILDAEGGVGAMFQVLGTGYRATRVNDASGDEAPVDFDTPTPPATEGAIGIGVIANGDIFVSITVDGAEVFSGQMTAGDATEVYRGDHITVFTSDDSLTAYTSLTSDYFTMGGSGESQWDFP